MSYVVPRTWSHGEYPTAAEMTDIKSSMDYLNSVMGDGGLQKAVALRNGFVQGYYIVHRLRWLVYKGAGRIEDPAGVSETVSLSAADDGGYTSYDLDQIDWLVPGKIYQVQAVTACLEDYEGY